MVVATRNQGKRREIEQILGDLPVELIGLEKFPGCPAIVEDGNSFEENATKKALVVADFTRMHAMGEDSGIEVDALGGLPGIYSARFAGQNASDEENNRLLLEKLRDVPPDKRSARYRCAIAIAEPGRLLFTVEGECPGIITRQPVGSNGFGYDPIFCFPLEGKTFGQLSVSMKNQVSHRFRALCQLKVKLAGLLTG
jgi:XTP/dITP diphosphohydrolase